MTSAGIVEIKHFAVHDGPGIRTTVFLKGCPLRCLWCHNPESTRMQPELAVLGKCVKCGACAVVCPCHQVEKDVHVLDRNRCVVCGKCVEACLYDALVLYGTKKTTVEVFEELIADRAFYAQGGGVTVSGGEPLLHSRFCAELFAMLHAEGIHCAVDTCGEVAWEAFETILPQTDLFLYDVKEIDPEKHWRFTGVSNQRILENLKRLARSGMPIEIRMPIIPGLNDSEQDIAGAGAFLAQLGHSLTGVRLLPYHALSRSKYRAIGHLDTMPEVDSPSQEHLDRLKWILTDCGVMCL